MKWPAVPVVARAYADQLRRAGALDASYDARLGAALKEAIYCYAVGASEKEQEESGRCLVD